MSEQSRESGKLIFIGSGGDSYRVQAYIAGADGGERLSCRPVRLVEVRP